MSHQLDSIINFLQSMHEDEYLCVTDIASCSRRKLLEWFRNKQTMEFIKVWETVNNPDFDVSKKVELNKICFSKWIREHKAIGIMSRYGQYRKTYAHKEIAFHLLLFCNPDLYALLIKSLIYNPTPVSLPKPKPIKQEVLVEGVLESV